MLESCSLKTVTFPQVGQDGGSRARVQLEKELDQVTGLLTSLSSQGEQLAKVMDAYRSTADSKWCWEKHGCIKCCVFISRLFVLIP